MILFANEEEKKLFSGIMERYDESFDAEESMITEWRGENGYHSRIVNRLVHSVVISLEYAYDLMCRGTKQDFQRAEDIIRKVLPLQDADPARKTYGIWPYYLEEPLEEMNPPDWNMADFNGKKLYQMLRDYRNKISRELVPQMETALEHACRSIMRRDMGPHYTNISIMGSYVAMAAGEYLKKEDLKEYAKERFRKAHRFNMDHGAFQEFNSPSYTWIVISDLAAVLSYIEDGEFRAMADDLNNLAWGCLAEHFHFRTKQWAGPHSRFYEMLQDDRLLMQIQKALDYRVSLVALDKEGLAEKLPLGFFAVQSRCPEQYIHYFVQETKERFGYTKYVHSQEKWQEETAASYVAPDCTLGTFHKSIFWNQRRNHISYFGTAENPIYCSLKCLHDFYDYSSGLQVTAQNKAKSLTVFGFCTDGGDTHPDLDKVKGACIEAQDLRIRFEIGGATDRVHIYRESEESFYFDMGECRVHVTVPYAALGRKRAVCRITEENGHVNETGGHKETGNIKCLDIILYEGERTRLAFDSMEECFGVIGFEILRKGQEPQQMPEVIRERELVSARMGDLRVEAPIKAETMQEYLKKAWAWAQDKKY